MSDVEYVTVTGMFLRQTEKAIHLELDNTDEVWIPKSVIRHIRFGELTVGETLELSVREWFCTKEGIDFR